MWSILANDIWESYCCHLQESIIKGSGSAVLCFCLLYLPPFPPPRDVSVIPGDAAAILEHQSSNKSENDDLAWGGRVEIQKDPGSLRTSLLPSLLVSKINNSLTCWATAHQIACYQQPNPLLPDIIISGSIKTNHFFSWFLNKNCFNFNFFLFVVFKGSTPGI